MVNDWRIRTLFLMFGMGIAVMTCSAGIAQAESGSGAEPITVMSFNIRYDNPGDGDNRWELRVDAVAQQIRDLDPEILCLQEALRHQLDQLEERVPGYTEIGVGRDDGVAAGEYSAILVKTDRFSVIDQGTWWLAERYYETGARSFGNTLPRIVTWAVLTDDSGDRFTVFNTHLDHESQRSREESVKLIRQFMWYFGSGPLVLTGDFNAGEDNPALDPLRREFVPGSFRTPIGLRIEFDSAIPADAPWHQPFRDTFRVLHPDADSVGTYNSWTGDRSGEKIDYVFTSAGWKILDAGILNETVNGRITSDHFPVYATIKAVPLDPNPGQE